MKKVLPLLLIPLLLFACNQQTSDAEKEFNESGRAKAIEREEDLWNHYEDSDSGFSFKYPHNVSLGEGISVSVEPIDSLEGTMGYNKETALKNQEALENGDYGEGVDFPLEASKQVVSVGDTNAQQFMVLGRFEVCHVTFERKLYFFHDDHQIVITLFGSKENIVQSSPEFFTSNPENCGEMLIWDFDKQADFYSSLANGEGSETAQEWFDTFDRIVATIEFEEVIDVVKAKVEGTWVSVDDERSSIIFSGNIKTYLYDDEEVQHLPFSLLHETEYGVEGPFIRVGEGDDVETYAIMELTQDELTLLHLPRGNILRYER